MAHERLGLVRDVRSWRVLVAGGVLGAAVASAIAGIEAQGGDVQICVGADRVLRVAEGGVCKAGESSLGSAGPLAAPPGGEADLAEYKRRLAQLEERVRSLEDAASHTGLGRQRVTAPFEVVDRSGKTILKVIETPKRQLELYNQGGAKVAAIEASDDGGRFVAAASNQRQVTALVAWETFSGVVSNEDDKRRLELGRGDKGNYRLLFMNAAGEKVAGLGQMIETGAGNAFVLSPGGGAAELLLDDKGSAQINVLSPKRIAVAQLRQTADGSGALMLTNASGVPMVDAGVISDSFGVVRAGPAAFKSGVGLLGLPGSYIAGKPAQ